MSVAVDLHGGDLAAQLLKDAGFVADMARYSESLLTEKYIRKKYSLLTETSWSLLAESDELISAIEAESVRRMMDGSSKKEKAKLHVMRAPDVAAKIMLDESANNRHRLDACKVLDDFSATGPQSAPASDRVIITINLGADSHGNPVIEHYDKAISIDANDTAPNIGSARTAVSQGPPLSATELALLELMKRGD